MNHHHYIINSESWVVFQYQTKRPLMVYWETSGEVETESCLHPAHTEKERERVQIKLSSAGMSAIILNFIFSLSLSFVMLILSDDSTVAVSLAAVFFRQHECSWWVKSKGHGIIIVLRIKNGGETGLQCTYRWTDEDISGSTVVRMHHTHCLIT